ncbi:shikimate kinase [Candidatus Uzinura diaspidicola str. ASNER]|uniref:Shikimate kinase n=1 Tax=Candidatus Uzinura diaspidicola str. ASNER TaxID=1133592 RepID=L7VJL8_9FLAO|nr:shikimate kinase [Candidatus Uzinura diaspidicola str. ASNER]
MYIILIGYMGSGKTTVGSLLSFSLVKKFYDLDDIIITWKNQDIHNIFVKNGENYFRKIETDVLQFLRSIKKKIVLSTGGGTPCFSNNIYFLNRLGITFYLHLSPEEIFKRIRYQKYKRPLISSLSDDKLLYFIHKHISNRIKYYNKSIYKLEIVNRFPEEIAFSIHKKLSIIYYNNGIIKPFK